MEFNLRAVWRWCYIHMFEWICTEHSLPYRLTDTNRNKNTQTRTSTLSYSIRLFGYKIRSFLCCFKFVFLFHVCLTSYIYVFVSQFSFGILIEVQLLAIYFFISIMNRKLKQKWSTIPPISTKRTSSHWT